MDAPEHVTEIFLHPGEYYFGDANTRIRTLLGSCVSLTMWHPRRRIGGMCHYMLAERKSAKGALAADGRYADDAVQLFLRDIRRSNTAPSDYQIKIFGGGNMFPRNRGRGGRTPVSDHNIEIAKTLVRQHGFRLTAESVGGNGYRQVIFDVWSGDVWVKYVDVTAGAAAVAGFDG